MGKWENKRIQIRFQVSLFIDKHKWIKKYRPYKYAR